MNGNEKRIAVNTVVLYVRMLLVMGLSFVTTRILLQTLGVNDFGLANVISSIASMFAFVTATFSSGCSRYYANALGRNDAEGLRRVFLISLVLYAIVAVVLLALFETVGLWYVNAKLVCDPSRTAAARTFYQLVVAQTLVAWFVGPFSALLIAHEKMTRYSILSIADGLLRFVIAVILALAPTADRLVPYGVLLVVSAILSLVLSMLLSSRLHNLQPSTTNHQSSTSPRTLLPLFLSLCSFNGWRMTSVFSWTAGNIFVNLLLNAYFGPAVNAARAIAMQVQTGVRALNDNFVTAARPQLVKLWAAGEKGAFNRLLVRSIILSFLLVLVFALPVFLLIEWILELWLGSVPAYAAVFTRLVLTTALVNSVSHPLCAAVHAMGNIKAFELTGALIFGLAWPLSFLALRLGYGPASVFWIALVLSALSNAAQFLVAFRRLNPHPLSTPSTLSTPNG